MLVGVSLHNAAQTKIVANQVSQLQLIRKVGWSGVFYNTSSFQWLFQLEYEYWRVAKRTLLPIVAIGVAFVNGGIANDAPTMARSSAISKSSP